MKNLLKLLLQLDLLKLFFLNLFCLDLPGRQLFFFDKCYFRFCFYFISKKRRYRLPKGFFIFDVTHINITKEVHLFTPNQVTQRLCAYYIPFYQCHFFVFKNLFLRRDLFMTSLFIFLFMKDAWFAQAYHFLCENVLE